MIERVFLSTNDPLQTIISLLFWNSMAATIEDLTMNFEEDGLLLVKETGKEVLSKGAWTTILFRYQNWEKAKNEYSKEMYSIRRYQKRQGEYVQKSKFTISSSEQAEKLITILQTWLNSEKSDK